MVWDSSFIVSPLVFIVLFKSRWTTLEPCLISSEASNMFLKIKQKLCANVPKGPLNNFNVQTKNSVKSNHFKQFTMWNGISRRSKFPDKTKNLSCLQQIKFCITWARYCDPFYDITWTNIRVRGPFLRPHIVHVKYHKLCHILGQLSEIVLGP